MKTVSLIIPCFNERDSLKQTYQAISDVLQRSTDVSHEMIFVDDGSQDNTFSIIYDIAAADSRVKYVTFTRNFGKEAAMLAGLKNASGDAVIIMDADLQHPPHLILDMLAAYEDGYHQVVAKRTRTNEKPFRKWMTMVYYKMINKLIDVELVDGIGDFRLLSRQAVDTLLQMPEYNRFSKGLFSWIGYEKNVIEYDNQERVAGSSKWGFSKLLNYAIDGIISFNSKPLRLLIYMGLIITLLNMVYIGVSFVQILLFGIDVPGYFTLISSVLFLGGVQLISIGILGEYVGRIFYEVKRRPEYVIYHTNIHSKEHRTDRQYTVKLPIGDKK
ncbi:glycosyltransferase family 2 protein [Lentibacillus halophilus]|uniref:Glycosyltransferase family 2 protein n=1 Tax=Lentibacillus halophilus TaxID=295065 RepID=A0ABN0Z686_9BACI